MPASGRSRVASMRRVVVLPAPGLAEDAVDRSAYGVMPSTAWVSSRPMAPRSRASQRIRSHVSPLRSLSLAS